MDEPVLKLLNVHGGNDVRQIEIQRAEPLVPEPSDFAMGIEKLNSHQSPCIDQIPAEIIKAGGRTICSEIHKLINSIWNKENLPEKWKESIIAPMYKKGDKTDCSNYRGVLLLYTTYKILSNILLSRLTPYAEEMNREHKCGFDATGQLLIIYSAFVKYLTKNWNTTKQRIRLLESL